MTSHVQRQTNSLKVFQIMGVLILDASQYLWGTFSAWQRLALNFVNTNFNKHVKIFWVKGFSKNSVAL